MIEVYQPLFYWETMSVSRVKRGLRDILVTHSSEDTLTGLDLLPPAAGIGSIMKERLKPAIPACLRIVADPKEYLCGD